MAVRLASSLPFAQLRPVYGTMQATLPGQTTAWADTCADGVDSHRTMPHGSCPDGLPHQCSTHREAGSLIVPGLKFGESYWVWNV